MNPSRRLTAMVIGAYWLMLVAGMVLYSAIRIDTFEVVIPIWIGAIGGTVLGQVFALRNARLWVPITAALAIVMFFGTNLSQMLWIVLALPHHYSSGALWWSFLPAVVCGYWSLGDRSSLAAFWFPAMIWMLSILDHATASAILDQSGIVLLCTLVVAFVLFLRVRESRRVDLWRTIAPTPLATTKPAVVLEENPNHRLVRMGWTFAATTLTFAATAWVAPRLWQGESFDKHDQQPQIVDGLPCCPSPDEIVTRSRVKEYFNIGRGHDGFDHPPIEGLECVVCPAIPTTSIAFAPELIPDVPDDPAMPLAPISGDDTPRPLPSAGTTASTAGTTTFTPTTMPEAPAGTVVPPRPPTRPAAAATPSGPVAPPSAHDALPAPPPPPHVPPPPRPHESAAAPPVASHVHAKPPSVATRGPAILRWAEVLVAALLLFQLIVLALRPLRRLVTLRHLRRPYWEETVDQRVSNSWQLALVGLRDAGWRSIDSEAPREFAHRVRIDGVERCATILERARHGLAIDAGDLSEMGASAETAYRSARSRMGLVARAASWLRWPIG